MAIVETALWMNPAYWHHKLMINTILHKVKMLMSYTPQTCQKGPSCSK